VPVAQARQARGSDDRKVKPRVALQPCRLTGLRCHACWTGTVVCGKSMPDRWP